MARNIIAVTNQKGGVGKTTTSVNLASGLAQSGKNVLLIDLDPQANTTSGLGVDTSKIESSVYNVLFSPDMAEDALVETSYQGLSLLPATPELAGAEVELVQELNREGKLKSLISKFDFDYTIIDCPPSLSLLTINALTAANYYLVPVQAEYYALEGLSHLLNTAQRVRQALNPELELLGVLLTMYDSRTTLSSQVNDELKRHFGDKVFGTVIPRNVRLAEAPSHGKPIGHYDRWSKGARSYKQLAKEVIKRTGGNNE